MRVVPFFKDGSQTGIPDVIQCFWKESDRASDDEDVRRKTEKDGKNDVGDDAVVVLVDDERQAIGVEVEGKQE